MFCQVHRCCTNQAPPYQTQNYVKTRSSDKLHLGLTSTTRASSFMEPCTSTIYPRTSEAVNKTALLKHNNAVFHSNFFFVLVHVTSAFEFNLVQSLLLVWLSVFFSFSFQDLYESLLCIVHRYSIPVVKIKFYLSENETSWRHGGRGETWPRLHLGLQEGSSSQLAQKRRLRRTWPVASA